MAPASRVYVGLGSNIEPRENLRLGVAELERRFGPLELSPVYRNPAVGFDGPDFWNLAAAFESAETPASLVAQFQAIHDLAGRNRQAGGLVSRTLDIDLLMVGDVVQDDPPLPRADILDYAFVLKPLSDLAPALEHPLTGRTMREHWQAVDDGRELERVAVELREPDRG